VGSSGIRRPVVEYIDIDRVEEVSCRRLQVLRCWWCCDVLDVSRRAASRSFNFGQEFLFFIKEKELGRKIVIAGGGYQEEYTAFYIIDKMKHGGLL